MMLENTINNDLCKQCKLCIEVCPCNVIEFNGHVRFIPGRENICLQCGQCMAVCKTKAINIQDLSYENDFVPLLKNKLGYEEFIDFISSRRSIRNFKDKPVSNDIINKVLESVCYAPYGASPEKMNITVVNNRERIEQALPYISAFLDNIVKWIENPVASFMIKNKKGPETFNTIKNHLYPIAKAQNYKLEFGDRITRHAPALLIFHANKKAEEHTDNSLIYATYTTLAAHALGLGAAMTEITAAAINKVKEVRDIFEIPDHHEAVISVILGYPKYSYQRAIRRNVHHIHTIN